MYEATSKTKELSVLKLVWWIILWLFAIIIISGAFFTVNPWQVGMIVKFGKVQDRVYEEWLYFKTPFVDNIEKVSVKNRKIEATDSAASNDLQSVTTQITLNYAINKSYVRQLYQNVGKNDDIESVLIAPAIKESIKSATAKYNAEQLITERSEVREAIVENLKSKLVSRWVDVLEVNITDFSFSTSFDSAIEAKVKAEQDALAEKNKLEQVKFQAQQQIEQSKAEAEKIRIQAEAITKQGGEEYVQLQRISKWNWQLPTIQAWQWAWMLLDASSFFSK